MEIIEQTCRKTARKQWDKPAFMELTSNITIPLQSVAAWLKQEGIVAEDVAMLRLSREMNELIASTATGASASEVSIQVEELWDWVKREVLHLEPAMHIAFGPPEIDGHSIHLAFAASSLRDPHEWPIKPDCIRQWERNDNRPMEILIEFMGDHSLVGSLACDEDGRMLDHLRSTRNQHVVFQVNRLHEDLDEIDVRKQATEVLAMGARRVDVMVRDKLQVFIERDQPGLGGNDGQLEVRPCLFG